jgi:hypothetical protein
LVSAYILTVVIEGLCLAFLLKPIPPLRDIIRYSVFANLASYAVITLLPFVIMLFIVLGVSLFVV